MTNHNAEELQLNYARVAGFMYLLIIIIGVLNGIFIDSELIVSGNKAATANNILANDFLFRTGIASILILYVSVVILAWALYVILKTVNKNLALLAMLLRSGEAILGGATVLISFIVLLLLNAEDYSTIFEKEQLQALAGLFLNVRDVSIDIVLIFVGIGGTIFCYLFFKSSYIPRILALWGIFTYMSMLLLALINILFPNRPEMMETVLFTLGALFELLIGFWLLFKGVNFQQEDVYASGSA